MDYKMQDTAALPLPIGAAHKPAPAAQPDLYLLGVNYMMGRGGVAADLGMAAASFLDAADANDPRGLYAAGMMYLKGIGVTASAEAAMGHLQKSAGLGSRPARKVLDALSQGKDVSAFPIAVAEIATRSVPDSHAARPAAKNPITPGRMLAIVVAAIVVVGGSGAGYWTWAKQAERQRVVAAEQARVADEQRQLAETKQPADAAAVPVSRGFVTDDSRQLTEKQALDLAGTLARIALKGYVPRLLLVKTTASESIEAYSSRVANSWKDRPESSPIDLLIVVATDDRRIQLATSDPTGKVSDVLAQSLISEQFVPVARRRGIAAGLVELLVKLDVATDAR